MKPNDIVMDIFTKEKRSKIMSRVRGKNTKPEMLVRSLLHNMGYRFRLHRKDLPGTPDIVLPRYRKIILVHGCFWHGHRNCTKSKIPSTNEDYWRMKIEKNMDRDRNNILALKALGWNILIVWTCEMKNREVLISRMDSFIKN